ncbi:MAG TPA: DUF2975 domain-containing protein [Candidatus Izemoplasmatales bacterium]|nr:DUF2975 domain-containing protein [Candidatus Izemoplasmatales bacterium]
MAKILYLIGIVALVVLVTVKMVVNPEIFDFDLSNITSYNITTGLVDIDVPIEPVNEIVNLASMIMYGRLTMMVDFASFYYIFTKFDKIIQHVKEEQPFHKYNLPLMFLIGKLFVIFSIALPIISLQFVWNIASNLPFDIDVNLAIHTGMLLLGGVILFLAGIFNYGAYLQDEYDQRCNHDCDSIR